MQAARLQCRPEPCWTLLKRTPLHHADPRPSSHYRLMSTPLSPEEIDQLAKRRAGAKLGWYLHAGIYVLVNLGLMALALSQGRHWAVYPALGWGLGLLVHGLVVWLARSSTLWQRLVQRELQTLQQVQKQHGGNP